MKLTIARLRADAIRRAFPPPASLKRVLNRIGFVQADPIRSPARAQDLILRHRVVDYRAGDLERLYPTLDIEEDFLYAYGFLTRANWRLLHPRVMAGISDFERRVLDAVSRKGQLHPRELEAELGRERAVNAWGGYSKATTHALHALHFRGLLRIAAREQGIRVYEAAPSPKHPLPTPDRLRTLVVLICRILAPISVRSLLEAMRLLRHSLRGVEMPRSTGIIDGLRQAGELASGECDGVTYLWPAGRVAAAEPPEQVRLLAPFDPLVWDRRRFEHFWGWAYRFEAYTPEHKRVRGYYAMPLLWRDDVIGWGNASLKGGQFHVKAGFVDKRPSGPAFRKAFEEEAERMRAFLKVRNG